MEALSIIGGIITIILFIHKLITDRHTRNFVVKIILFVLFTVIILVGLILFASYINWIIAAVLGVVILATYITYIIRKRKK